MFCSFLVVEQEQPLALAVRTARRRLLAKVMPPPPDDGNIAAQGHSVGGRRPPYADVDESARQEVVVAWPVDERRRLLAAERASLHLRTGESGLAELVELGKIGVGFDDVDLGVGTDILQAELVNLAE